MLKASAPVRSVGMFSEGHRAGGSSADVEDEFACAGMLRGSLTSLHGTVERIFRVTFNIGVDGPPHGSGGQIWLKLRGASANVEAAKLFTKGLVNQEEQKEVSYPEVLHCIFCGAKGLFMDSLIRNTSALIVVSSPGFLHISGLAEPVVRAYSLVTELISRCEGNQSRDTGERGVCESLDSRRAFKTLVEKWEDRHILDLLVLSGPVKEVLLDLVKESGLGLSPAPSEEGSGVHKQTPWDSSGSADRAPEGVPAIACGGLEALLPPTGSRGRAEGAERTPPLSPQEVGEEESQGGVKVPERRSEDQEVQSSPTNKEFWLLLKFFTAMGYTEDVVKRVLARTGLKEASQILDLVQQEQDCSDRQRENRSFTTRGDPDLNPEQNRPCETEHREEEVGTGDSRQEWSRVEDEEAAMEEDFVLGVLKKAAASCGYTEQNVAKVYSSLSEGSAHQLLLELQRGQGHNTREGPRETEEDAIPEKDGTDQAEGEKPGDKAGDRPVMSDILGSSPPQMFADLNFPKLILPEVKGPPTSIYPPSLDPQLPTFQPCRDLSQPPNWSIQAPQPQSSAPKYPHPGKQHPVPSSTYSVRTKERQGFMPPPSLVVTGEQRFLEGLQTPFKLKLTDQPGNPSLRTIIIDGSNVAMSHGLGHFFSCRGIALAVQHFWDRGHRNISALIPQWRQKSDSRIKEKHYLTELQTVGLLHYTPSREVLGKRISSYDDRLILQLAQKTDGVIVTNDNLRDLLDESVVWRDIIKKRLLQYTFVGDLFMVPDDPLGRGGPHLDQFLSLQQSFRAAVPGSHSFAGLSSTLPSKPPRSQTEVLNFRDRTAGGALGDGTGRRPPAGRAQRENRTAEQTSELRLKLCQVFPGQDSMVALQLQLHPAETDVNLLSSFILEQQD
uniref:KH and NYN domain containing n=1 Tax=Oryzias latipes TaxID=8090 RepID=A0A3P9MK74_ORYLA